MTSDLFCKQASRIRIRSRQTLAIPHNQTEDGHRAEREASVHLAPLVAEEAAVRLLQRGHVPGDRLHVDVLQAIVRAQNLDGAQRVQDVRIVAVARRHAAGLRTLTLADVVDDLGPIEPVQLAHQVEGGDAPVDARHAQELGHAVFLSVREEMRE